MSEAKDRLFFIDRFVMSFKGIELIILHYIVATFIQNNSLSPDAFAILEDILTRIAVVMKSHDLIDPPEYFCMKKSVF